MGDLPAKMQEVREESERMLRHDKATGRTPYRSTGWALGHARNSSDDSPAAHAGDGSEEAASAGLAGVDVGQASQALE